MTAAREVLPDRTYLITRRCTQRQLLLRPDDVVEQIYLYCLAEAVERYGVVLHAFVAMSNHQHLLVRDPRGNFPEFLGHLHKMVAKAMNTLRRRRENFWATEQPNAVHVVDAHDRFEKLVYILANPVKEHLVERVADWPGACSFGLHLSGRSITVKKPRVFFRRHGAMPDEVTLIVHRPTGFETLTEEQWSNKVADAVRAEEESARRERVRTGLRVLGRKAVLRAAPTAFARSVEPRRELKPEVACANRERRIAVLLALRSFRNRRRIALARYWAGERGVAFPAGTYRVVGVFVSAPAGLPFSLADGGPLAVRGTPPTAGARIAPEPSRAFA
ncbi:MAG: hypothetical protein JWP97_5623 [Labilithrix sp.]|nr:hypothetical protein [Labilithrix sp.]